MSKLSFPDTLNEYFSMLHSLFGAGETSLTTEEPWFFKPGIKAITSISTDAAVKRYRGASWSELLALYASQIARSDFATKDQDQESHFEHVCGALPCARNFGQLSCTKKSIDIRVNAISKMTHRDAPILIIGDDDALSVALAMAGFTDLTVFEIDPEIVECLAAALERFPATRSRLVQQDILAPVPAELIRPYQVVSFDPWYAMEGLEAFMNGGTRACEGAPPEILLSFNCGALLSEFPRFKELLKQRNYAVTSWEPLVNTYPIARSLARTLEVSEFTVALLSLNLHRPFPRRRKIFLSSDLLTLSYRTP